MRQNLLEYKILSNSGEEEKNAKQDDVRKQVQQMLRDPL